MSSQTTDDLHAELAALRAENEALRARGDGRQTTRSPPPARSERPVARRSCPRCASSSPRSWCPVSIVGAWARVQLVDEDAFVATLAPLVDDPAVQAMIIDESMEAINAQVDFRR